MAIKIRKIVKEESPKKVLEPEVLPPEGGESGAGVKPPEMNDNFLRTSGTLMEWIVEHRRAVTLCVVLVAAVAFGIVGWNHHKEVEKTSKSQVLTSAFITYSALTKDEAQMYEMQRRAYIKQQGIAADTTEVLQSNYTVPNNEARFVAITKYLEEELPKLQGEAVGTSGRLMLAGAAARVGKMDVALDSYQKAMQSHEGGVVLFGELGDLERLIDAQKYDEALNLLEKMNGKNPKFASYFTLEKGRIYEMRGERDKALNAYKEVIQYHDANDMKLATERLRALTADWEKYIQQAVPENREQTPNAQAM